VRGFFFLGDPSLLHLATRYHYAALIPVTIALCVLLRSVGRRVTLPRLLPAALVLLWTVGGMTALILAPPWLRLYPTERQQTLNVLVTMHAVAAATKGPIVYMRNRVFQPVLLMGPVFPKIASLFTLFFRGDSLDGKRFYFVEPDEETRTYNARGVPIGRLLIAPEDVPPDTILR